jgi:hypothetical protein
MNLLLERYEFTAEIEALPGQSPRGARGHR